MYHVLQVSMYHVLYVSMCHVLYVSMYYVLYVFMYHVLQDLVSKYISCGKVQWNSLAIEVLLHQTFRQLTATFVSGMTTRSVCAVKYKCVTVSDE